MVELEEKDLLKKIFFLTETDYIVCIVLYNYPYIQYELYHLQMPELKPFLSSSANIRSSSELISLCWPIFPGVVSLRQVRKVAKSVHNPKGCMYCIVEYCT